MNREKEKGKGKGDEGMDRREVAPSEERPSREAGDAGSADLLSALDAFSRLEGLDEDEDDLDLDEEDDYSDLRPISEWQGEDEDDDEEEGTIAPPRDPGDVLGIRGLLEEDDGLGEMFFQALLSAREGDLADANVFAEKLVEVFNETPRPELGGVSPDAAFASFGGQAAPVPEGRKKTKRLDGDEPLRKPRARGRDRSPLPETRGTRGSL